MNSQAIIDVLNNLLEAEIASIEYYNIHAEAIEDEDIANGIRDIIPAEESHAINLSKRIQELGGVPVTPPGDAARTGREMGEQSKKKGTLGMLSLELEQEQKAIRDYAIPVAEIVDDMITLEMLEEQLLDEMRHAKWLKQKIMELKEGNEGRQVSV